ncbi:thiopeptide-type bacteriocin biosynthesis protein [Nonomuraea sp. KM88]|uniref:thiopeptide-type bacteriocin biosynthesis protein n=1 Tax=Nonomuraea sp. KM88 TaxID=3457427 RepID=UPI003FCE1A13
MSERQWLSAHIYYHGNLDEVIVRIVAPLARAGAELFFLRYWDGGPHVRVRVATEPHTTAGVRRELERRCAELFRDRPARFTLDPADYAREAAEMARLEQVTAYAAEPAANNTLAFVGYEPEYVRYGRAYMAAVERHFTESSRIVLPLVTGGLSGTRRMTVALSMILSTWWRCRPDPARLARAKKVVGALDVDPAFAEVHEQRREAIAELTRRAADGRWDEGPLTAWTTSVDALAAHVDEPRALFPILNSCAHLACNRLGVDVSTEALLRYLAARAVTDLAREKG